MNGLEDELERRTLTFTMWNHSVTKAQTSWHPVTFDYDDASAKKIKEIKVSLVFSYINTLLAHGTHCSYYLTASLTQKHGLISSNLIATDSLLRFEPVTIYLSKF